MRAVFRKFFVFQEKLARRAYTAYTKCWISEVFCFSGKACGESVYQMLARRTQQTNFVVAKVCNSRLRTRPRANMG